MIIREIKPELDLEEIAKWFQTRKWPMPPIENIGPSFGLIAEDQEGNRYGCVWLYTTGRSLAYVDWLAVNPEFTQAQGNQAIQLIMDHIKQMCQVSDPKIKALCLFTKNRALANHMTTMGFKKEDNYQRLLWTSK